MLGQAKNIKGFNLLELIVVLTIVGVISAVAYPNFSSWNKERKVRIFKAANNFIKENTNG